MGNPSENEEEVMEQLIALGYIDPGAGSSMWQIILAKVFKIKSAMRKLFGRKKIEEEEEEE